MSLPIIMHNGWYFDKPILERHGIKVNLQHDTLIMAYVTGIWAEDLGENKKGKSKHPLSLKTLSREVLGYEQGKIGDLFSSVLGSDDGDYDFSRLPVSDPRVVQYATDDAWCTYRLFRALKPDVKAKAIYKLEQSLAPIALEIQRTGVQIDLPYLRLSGERLRHAADWLLGQLRRGQRADFNPSSGDQVAELLYNQWRLPVLSKTKTGKRQVDEHTLNQLIRTREAAPHKRWLQNLLTYKALDKALGTYVGKLPALSDETGVLRCQYRQFGASTGRFSSAKPNLQNLSRGEHWDIHDTEPMTIRFDLRRAFIARPDHYLIASDYKQIEAIIMACASQDPAYLRMVVRGGDIHTNTAAEMLGIDPEEVTKEDRSRAKTVNYGWSYGQGPDHMSKRNNMTLARTKHLIQRFERTFARLVEFRAKFIEQWYRQEGWAYTYFGRPRYIPYWNSKLRGERMHGERAAFNHYVQGTAGDIQKLALLRISQAIVGKQARIIMHTHDDNVVEAHNDEDQKELIAIIKKAMSIDIAGWLPFTADHKICQHLS